MRKIDRIVSVAAVGVALFLATEFGQPAVAGQLGPSGIDVGPTFGLGPSGIDVDGGVEALPIRTWNYNPNARSGNTQTPPPVAETPASGTDTGTVGETAIGDTGASHPPARPAVT